MHAQSRALGKENEAIALRASLIQKPTLDLLMIFNGF